LILVSGHQRKSAAKRVEKDNARSVDAIKNFQDSRLKETVPGRRSLYYGGQKALFRKDLM
jgi:hypothetical protein